MNAIFANNDDEYQRFWKVSMDVSTNRTGKIQLFL